MALQGTGPDIRLGLTAQPGSAITNGVANAWFETFGPNVKRWHYGWRLGLVQSDTDVFMQRDHWYRMEVGLSSDDRSNFSLTARVDDYGLDGTLYAGNVLDLSFAFRDDTLGAADTLYAGFYAHGDTTAFDAFEFANASAVPLPAGLWLLGSACAAWFAPRRTCRRAGSRAVSLDHRA